MKFRILALVFALSSFSAHGQTSRPVVTPAAASAPTAIPALVPYSGVAINGEGKPFAGEVNATFLIYRDEQGGEPLWVESQVAVVDSSGHYKVQLGATNPNGLPSDLFATGEARWLEVQITGEAAQPRVLLASVPYALKAADAATLGGLPASAFALAGSRVASNFGIADAAGIVPDSATTVTTTGGKSGYLPQFSGTSTILDSILYATSTGVGVGDVPNSTAVFDVNGKSIWRGLLNISRAGNATSSTGYDSYPLFFQASSYNSNTKAVTSPEFQLQAEPTGNNTASPAGTFNLLYNANGGTPTETGLSFNGSGIIHFSSGQTFPGTGAGTITGVTAGTGLTGGGTSGKVTLNLNTGEIPTLSGNNTFTGSNTFKPSIYEDTDVNIDNTNSNSGQISPGLRFGSASGEGISSQRTSGVNQYGLDFYTDYKASMSITASGSVGIGTRGAAAQLEIDATGSNDAIFANGVYDSGLAGGSDGIIAEGASTDGTSGAEGGYGAVFYGGGADNNTDAGDGMAVYAGDGNNGQLTYSAYFNSSIDVGGDVYSSVHASKIDSPLDPANKYLVHAAVQSSEMMNIYSGNVTTDELGIATVSLPDWFEAENGDFRYQLTTIGRDAHAWVSQEVANGQFKIATNATNVKVSWQITAVRQDAYAKAHPLVAEQVKPAKERGFYQHPELFGQPKEKQTEWGRHPKMMQRLQAERNGHKSATKVPVRGPVQAQIASASH
jgi:hypothetical protein